MSKPLLFAPQSFLEKTEIEWLMLFVVYCAGGHSNKKAISQRQS